MLQAGVATKDMDPRWMSSISWYFLCIFGLQSVFVFILGSDNGKFEIIPALPIQCTDNTKLPARWPSKWDRWEVPLVPLRCLDLV